MKKLNSFNKSQTHIRLFENSDCQSIAYNDGDTPENRIYEILHQAKDVSCKSKELKQSITDWPTEYHLSTTRHNLLSPFDLGKNKKILELGCGCGAITRQLGEMGHEIHAVEGSKRRATITAERCRDLDNVKVYNANYNEIDFDEQSYDFITLIGVLEYASLFLPEQQGDPLTAAQMIVNQLKKKLKPDGTLIIAIENKLGIKYLSGCTEDHTGIEFEGILDYPNTKGITTFTKIELSKIIKNAELENINFFYPFPDYKIPANLVSDTFINQSNMEALLEIPRDYINPRKHRFPEPLFAKSLIKEQQLDHFANSFLVFASNSKLDQPDFDLIHYSNANRKEGYQLITTKSTLSDQVQRQHRYTSPIPEEKSPLQHIVSDEAWKTGQLLSTKLLKDSLNQGSLDAFFDSVIKYYNYIQEFSRNTDQKGLLADLIFNNIIINESGEFDYFDLEWKIKEPGKLPFDLNQYILFRALFNWLLPNSPFLIHFREKHNLNNVLQVIQKGFEKLELLLPESLLNQFISYEAELQAEINFNKSKEDFITAITGSLSTSWPKHSEEYIAKIEEQETLLQERMNLITELQGQVSHFRDMHSHLQQVYAGLEGNFFELQNRERNLEEHNKEQHKQIVELTNQQNNLNNKIAGNHHHIHHIESHNQHLQAELQKIHQSRGWRWLTRYYTFMKWLLHSGGVRLALRSFLRDTKNHGPLKALNYSYLRATKQPVVEITPEIKRDIEQFNKKPLVSIVVPVYNVEPKWLILAVRSIKNQFYPHWELCLVDDASPNEATRKALKKIRGRRIKKKFLSKNGGISTASNAALSMCTGEYVALLDHDDELTPDALYRVVKAINEHDPDIMYSDEDKMTLDGQCQTAYYKPDYTPDMLLSQNYFCHLTVIKKSLIEQVGGFRPEYDGSQDYDLFLRAVEQTQKIHHIPHILYHWRMIPGSTAMDFGEKSYPNQKAKEAIQDALNRRKIKGLADFGPVAGTYEVRRELHSTPLVSIIIPFKDKPEFLDTCLDSIIKKSSYTNYEVLCINNGSVEPATKDLINQYNNHPKIQFIDYDVPFNFSKINNFAADKAKGEHLILLNNDIEIISEDWIEALLEHSQREEVGVVGAKLYYPNDTIQHAGVIIGVGGVAGHSHKHFNRSEFGYFNRASIIQNLCACTAACFMIKKKLFLELEGLNEKNLSVAFNDIDFCLRVYYAGYLNVFTPLCEAYHHESISRGFDDMNEKVKKRFESEVLYMMDKHKEILQKGDPYYNPNLTLDHENFHERQESDQFKVDIR